jgi:hypothetical protein
LPAAYSVRDPPKFGGTVTELPYLSCHDQIPIDTRASSGFPLVGEAIGMDVRSNRCNRRE